MSDASGLSWLGGKTWAQVTREERFFCAELFVVIRQGVREFVQFLVCENHWTERAVGEEVLRLEPDLYWDPAYEVCFYRDMLRVIGDGRLGLDSDTLKRIRKRTFDLALLSSEAIILIEAKAHQGFDRKQLNDVEKDRERVEEWTGRKPVIVGLVSSKYTPKCETRNTFDLMIRWKDLARWCGDERARRVFTRADEIYGD